MFCGDLFTWDPTVLLRALPDFLCTFDRLAANNKATKQQTLYHHKELSTKPLPVPNLQLVLGQHILDALHKGALVVGDQTDERSLLHAEQQEDDSRLGCRLWRKVNTSSLGFGFKTYKEMLIEHGQQ